jgi:hypothetical protein
MGLRGRRKYVIDGFDFPPGVPVSSDVGLQVRKLEIGIAVPRTSVAICDEEARGRENTMDETGMGCASRTKEPDSNRTESLGAGLEIQLGSRKSRRRRGRMGDAKNWRLNKERQSLKERRARVESAEREGAHNHNTGRREERSASVQQACSGSAAFSQAPCARGTGCDFATRMSAKEKRRECATTGQSRHGFALQSIGVLGGGEMCRGRRAG